MGKYYDQIRKLTTDPGARELARIAEVIEARLTACCGEAPSLAPARDEPAAPDAAERKPDPSTP